MGFKQLLTFLAVTALSSIIFDVAKAEGTADTTAKAAAPVAKPKRIPRPAFYGVDPGPGGGPTPRLIDGHPDLTSYWRAVRDPDNLFATGNIGKDLPGFKLPFTPAGEQAYQYNITKTIDPKSACLPSGVPRFNTTGLTFQMISAPSQVAFLMIGNWFRVIPIDGRKPDPDPDPRFFGNPVGHWEGDTLVIESNGFKDSMTSKFWIDENGNPISDQMKLVERWTRTDSAHMQLVMQMTDPKYYTHSFTYHLTFVPGKPGEMLPEFICNENNVDYTHLSPGPGGVVGPDGDIVVEYTKPLPKAPPPPDFYDKK